MNKSAIFEAVKEPLRLLVLAIIPFIVVWFGGFKYEWVHVAIAVLRAVDKYLHTVAPKGKAGGLVRF